MTLSLSLSLSLSFHVFSVYDRVMVSHDDIHWAVAMGYITSMEDKSLVLLLDKYVNTCTCTAVCLFLSLSLSLSLFFCSIAFIIFKYTMYIVCYLFSIYFYYSLDLFQLVSSTVLIHYWLVLAVWSYQH